MNDKTTVNIKTVRERARAHIAREAVAASYKTDRQKVIHLPLETLFFNLTFNFGKEL